MSKAEKPETKEDEPLICGIVRPISAFEDCTEAHWGDVHRIIEEALKDTGFKARLVSSADESGVIQSRIVQNLADDPMVICDVSTRNPNVMFELGMRLAFDLPTIVIKDDKTNYTFDAGVIEHLPYPRDLQYYRINDFKIELAKKVKATYEAAKDADYTTFLKHFKRLKSKKGLATEEVAIPQIVLDQLNTIRAEIAALDHRRTAQIDEERNEAKFILEGEPADLEKFRASFRSLKIGYTFVLSGKNKYQLRVPNLTAREYRMMRETAEASNVSIMPQI